VLEEEAATKNGFYEIVSMGMDYGFIKPYQQSASGKTADGPFCMTSDDFLTAEIVVAVFLQYSLAKL
jgi:hypothetical protein